MKAQRVLVRIGLLQCAQSHEWSERTSSLYCYSPSVPSKTRRKQRNSMLEHLRRADTTRQTCSVPFSDLLVVLARLAFNLHFDFCSFCKSVFIQKRSETILLFTILHDTALTFAVGSLFKYQMVFYHCHVGISCVQFCEGKLAHHFLFLHTVQQFRTILHKKPCQLHFDGKSAI